MDDDASRPFVLEGDYEAFGDAYPSVATLTVTVRAVTITREVERMRRYDERSLPSHAECPNCGYETAVGWAVAGAVEEGASTFDIEMPCGGLERVGRGCPYGFQLEGTVEYVDGQ